MKIFICSICGFSYNEETAEQDPSGEPIIFEKLSDDWTCPNCGVAQEFFIAPDDQTSSEDLTL